MWPILKKQLGGRDGSGNPGGARGRLPSQQPTVLAKPFSLTSGGYNLGIIDYASKNGLNHPKGATTNLEEKLYDCTPETLYQFIKILKVRSRYYGCTNVGGVFWFKTQDQQTVQNQNHLDNFRQYELKSITEHDIQIMITKSRTAQDNFMLYKCIIKFFSVEGKVKLNVHEKYYMFNYLPSVLCMFKVLVR